MCFLREIKSYTAILAKVGVFKYGLWFAHTYSIENICKNMHHKFDNNFLFQNFHITRYIKLEIWLFYLENKEFLMFFLIFRLKFFLSNSIQLANLKLFFSKYIFSYCLYVMQRPIAYCKQHFQTIGKLLKYGKIIRYMLVRTQIYNIQLKKKKPTIFNYYLIFNVSIHVVNFLFNLNQRYAINLHP